MKSAGSRLTLFAWAFDPQELVKEAEHCAYHCYFFGQPHCYSSKTRSLAFNLRSNAKEILGYEPQLWYGLTHDMMAKGTPVGAIRQQVYDRPARIEEMVRKFDESTPASKETTMVGKCRGCGSYNTSFTEVQTRRADEGMTVFKFCRDCQKRWK